MKLRPIGSKRARKLRKRGETVWWSIELNSLVWSKECPTIETSPFNKVSKAHEVNIRRRVEY